MHIVFLTLASHIGVHACRRHFNSQRVQHGVRFLLHLCPANVIKFQSISRNRLNTNRYRCPHRKSYHRRNHGHAVRLVEGSDICIGTLNHIRYPYRKLTMNQVCMIGSAGITALTRWIYVRGD